MHMSEYNRLSCQLNYCFSEIITMDRVNFSENGEYMQFRQIQTFVFNKNKSCPGILSNK